jgi:hypothetical protein
MVIVLVLIAVVMVVIHRPAGTQTRTGAAALAAETAVRDQTASWMESQVGRDIDIACDAVMCADLAQHGFLAGNLTVLAQAAPDPYGSQLVVATADIRSQFGSKLSSVYAPQVIATFGKGADSIAVRAIAASGPATFRTELGADLQARKSSGAELLGNSKIITSVAAQAELSSGQVDLRLITTLAFLAREQPLSIVGFGTDAGAASPGVPMRTVYLASTDPSSSLPATAYTAGLIRALGTQIPPYVPLSTSQTQYAGQSVLQIVFSAPSPLGLLKS